MSVAEIAATPKSLLPHDPGLGLGTTCQLVPSQCSVSVCSLPLFPRYPTAQMSVAETAATPSSSVSFNPGLGLGTTCQLVPFQCSISVWPEPPPRLLL